MQDIKNKDAIMQDADVLLKVLEEATPAEKTRSKWTAVGMTAQKKHDEQIFSIRCDEMSHTLEAAGVDPQVVRKALECIKTAS